MLLGRAVVCLAWIWGFRPFKVTLRVPGSECLVRNVGNPLGTTVRSTFGQSKSSNSWTMCLWDHQMSAHGCQMMPALFLS